MIGCIEKKIAESYLDQTGICDDGLQFNSIDEWLAESNILDTRVIETVDVIPD
jgi:hypothetical protein